MLPLRPYQQRIVDSVHAGYNEVQRQLVIVPTGGGKTIVFSHLAAAQAGRTLILAHRDELLDQAIEKLHRATGIFAQKEKADQSASLQSQVVVGSVQTIGRRLAKWPGDHFSLVVVDEAHHALADSYLSVLRHFDGFSKIVGVTATPDRGDKKNLGKYFERIAAEISLFELINAGYLSRISVKAIPLQIDIRKVRQTAGDYNEKDLADALAPYLRSIARAIKEHAPFRKTLVFLPLIATSKAFTEVCQAEGLSAAHIDGKSLDRKEILARFAEGHFDVLSNAILLTEGYDEPLIDCVIILRPTRSRSLYSQMVGRGTRIAEAKSNLLLLDFLWLHEKHSLIRPAHLVASTEDEAKQMSECAAGETQTELDLEDLASTAREEHERKLRQELAEAAKRKARLINPIEFCTSIDTALNDFEGPGEPVEPSQRKRLERAGFDLDAIKNSAHANQLIAVLDLRWRMNLATPKQLRVLKRRGYHHADTATFAEASAFIDSLDARRKPQPQPQPVAA